MSSKQELTKSINEIPTPWGRTLVWVLLIGISFMATGWYKDIRDRQKDCDASNDQKDRKIDSLENAAYRRADENRIFQDTLKKILKSKSKKQ